MYERDPIFVCLVFLGLGLLGMGLWFAGCGYGYGIMGLLLGPNRLVVLGSENVHLLVIILGLECINGIVASYILRNYFYRFLNCFLITKHILGFYFILYDR